MIRARENVVGAYAFLIGLIVSLVVGIFTGIWHLTVTPAILGVLALLGIIVGLFVAEKDIQTFLLASVSLVLVSYTGISGLLLGASFSGFEIGRMIASILQALLSLFIPATIVVAVKSVFSIAKS
jgi:hypothetical protein